MPTNSNTQIVVLSCVCGGVANIQLQEAVVLMYTIVTPQYGINCVGQAFQPSWIIKLLKGAALDTSKLNVLSE